MKYLKSLDIRVILIGVLFLLVFIIADKIITKKRDKINRENLRPFIDSIINKKVLQNRLSKSYVKWLCKSMMPIFLSEPSLLELEPPIHICGDIHGQLNDLLYVFEKGEKLPNATYLFLGDYVDRGQNSIEVICLLFALKLLYPKNIYLLRGNHESSEINEVFGFADECEEKLNFSFWYLFNNVFDTLPIGAVIGNKFFCVHGGLSPYLDNLDDVKKIERPICVHEDWLLSDLLWTDPKSDIEGWGPSSRGDTKTWGLDIAEYFLKQNNLKCIVRGHQMAQNGFCYPFDPEKNTITVFTASKYAKNNENQAAIMVIDDKKEYSFIIW